METLTQQGINAMRDGDKATARRLLETAVQQNPKDIVAWLWLSGAVSTDQERLNCLQQVIRIDPENAAAAKGIAQLISRGTVTVHMVTPKSEAVQSETNTVQRLNEMPQISKKEASEPQILQPVVSKLEVKAQQPQPSVQRHDKEEIIFKVSPSPLPVLIRGGLLLIILFLTGLIFRKMPSVEFFCVVPVFVFTIALIIVRLIQRSYAHYTLTSSQLIVQKGVLNRQKKTIPVSKIQDVSYRQPLLDRILGLGDVIVESAGERGAVYLVSLHNCVKLSAEILKIVQSE